jgi:hypothetical protein
VSFYSYYQCLTFSLTFLQATAEVQAPFDIDPDDIDDDKFTPDVDFEGAYTLSMMHTPPRADFSDSPEIISSSSDSDSDLDFAPVESFISKPTPAVKKPLIQSKLPFQPISVSEWRAQESRRYHERQEERTQEAERLKLVEARRAMERRERDCMRKRVQRAREKEARGKILQLSRSQNTSNQVCTLILILYFTCLSL